MTSNDEEQEHVLSLEPQPIADQWMGRCTCGWRMIASLHDFETGIAARSALQAGFNVHIAD
ncbi:hypothetical protein SPDO_32750 [Sphingomonas dokdonensis]|uniref:Uncharacterized protein n=1 Tax=Sphingomonas dokdonensis TaxID=344880 RepID=A0A245ZD32_9SPHN|nr:hypothetical protein SPDO_32750 [Sphingomonas dokdonensis]